MRMIDADELIRSHCMNCELFHVAGCGGCGAVRLIRDAPTIDAEPVVRCKDCVYSWGEGHACEKWNALVEPNDFCSKGIRRE